MPIHILYIIDSLTHGGTEKQLVQLINNLDRTRIQPHLCTLKASEGLYDELDIPKTCLNFQSFFSPSILSVQRRLVGFIKQHKIQIVQTFFQDPFLLGALVKPLTGVKLIGSFRDLGFWRTRSESIKMRVACRFLDGFIANSRAVKDHVVETYKLIPDKVEVIYNGIDLNSLPKHYQAAQNLEPVVGIVANLNRPVKRVEDFVRAAALVAGQQSDVRFLVVGGGHLQPELEQLAAKLGLAERITFTGRVDNPLDQVKTFTVGIITSETEGFCNAIIEYMALGLPVVVTDTGGNPELVTPGQNGFLCPVGDCNALAKEILKLLQQPNLRASVAISNRNKIREQFTLTVMTKQYEGYYLRLPGIKPKGTKELHWTLLTTSEDLNNLRAAWTRLSAESADEDFYLTWDWFYAVTHLAQHPPEQLRLFVAHKGEELVAIIPCMLVSKKLRFCRVRSLELLGNIYSPRRGVVVRKGLERELAQSFGHYLQQEYQREWDILDFIDISPADSFLASLRETGTTPQWRPLHPRVVTLLHDYPTAADFFRSLGSKMRGNLRRCINKINKVANLRLWLFCNDHQDNDAAVEAYRKIYQASWKDPEADPGFHPRLMDFLGEQQLRVFYLYLDSNNSAGDEFLADDFYRPDLYPFSTGTTPPAGEPVAVLYCIVHQGIAYSLKFSHDENFRDLGPGSVLFTFAVKHLIDVDKCKMIDHQKGDESYKFDWQGQLVGHSFIWRHTNRLALAPRVEFALTTLVKKTRDILSSKLNKAGTIGTQQAEVTQQTSNSTREPSHALSTTRTVVITGADHPTGLGTARALAGQHCHIIGFYKNETPSTRSKYWDQLIHVDDWEYFIPQLMELGRKLPEKAALFITQDAIVRQISEHREEMKPYFLFLLPTADVVNDFLDKGLFHQWALQHQFPVPQSHICTNREQLDAFLQSYGYPAIIKPYEKSERWDSFSPLDKAFVLQSANDIARIPFDLFAATDRLLAQQYIQGGDNHVYFCLVYYNQRGECVASFVGRKLFQWPVLCGNTAACVSDHNPDVDALTRRCFDLVGYQGLGSMEYKRNDVDGRYYMIEPTVGRNDFQSNIATVGGVNLTAIALADMFEQPRTIHQPRKAAWINEQGLLDAVQVLKRQGNLNYRDLLNLVKLRMGFAHWNWFDQAPGRFFIKKALEKKYAKTRFKLKSLGKQIMSFWVESYYLFQCDLSDFSRDELALPPQYRFSMLGKSEINALIPLWREAQTTQLSDKQLSEKIEQYFDAGHCCFCVYYGTDVIAMSWFVSADQSQSLPFAALLRKESFAAIGHNSYVQKEHRGCNLHKYLIIKRNIYAKQKGYKSIYVFVGVNNLTSAMNLKKIFSAYKVIVHVKIDILSFRINYYPSIKSIEWRCTDRLN